MQTCLLGERFGECHPRGACGHSVNLESTGEAREATRLRPCRHEIERHRDRPSSCLDFRRRTRCHS